MQGELQELLASRNGFLYNLLRYHLGWTDQHGQPEGNPGRAHFQSLLPLATSQAVAGDFTPALPVAAAIELVCHFMAVHGDVQAGRVDAQDRPSIWWVWGPAQAINAGDGLHALSRAAMMRLALAGVGPERVLQAVSALDRACLALCEGQYMDLSFQDQLMVTSTDYHDMIRRKSGSICACATELGALAAGAEPGVQASFQRFGSKLGMAWQIARDIAEFWGQGQDGITARNLLNKKKSFPLIYALENAENSVKRELGTIYAKRVLEPDDITRVVTVLDAADARRHSEEKARELVAEAFEEVAGLDFAEDGAPGLRELGYLALECSA